MGRRKSGGAEGIGCLVVICVIVWLFSEYPTWAWVGVGAVVLIGIVSLYGGGPESCEVCGAELKKTTYTWEISGEKKTVCPTCNRRLQSRKSKEAVDNLFNS